MKVLLGCTTNSSIVNFEQMTFYSLKSNLLVFSSIIDSISTTVKSIKDKFSVFSIKSSLFRDSIIGDIDFLDGFVGDKFFINGLFNNLKDMYFNHFEYKRR